MKIVDLLEGKNNKHDFIEVLTQFLPFIVKQYKLKNLPEIKLVAKVDDVDQPTFGKFEQDNNRIDLAILDRHPLDIIRTLAHELAHYVQGTEHRLNPHSGETGSREENEAHEWAGIAMRHFNKAHPEFFSNVEIPMSK